MNVALRPQPINLLSICTGGGGLDLGVELAIPSARSVCMVEREAFGVAQLVSAMEAGHLAPAPIWSDARTFDGRAWRGAVDGLIGGIPCQPHSTAGKRLERADPRDLWSTARRIIVQSGAWFVVIENVRGMLTSGGAERVWRDLRRLGFACELGLFSAAEVGATHERERLFILGVADARRSRRGESAKDAQGRQFELAPSVKAMADAPGRRRNQDWRAVSSEDRAGQASREFAGSGQIVVDAIGGGRPGRQDDAIGSEKRRAIAQWPIGLDIFPPGPSDLSGWRAALERAPELEPAFRRVANGLASRLDIARVDRLRMLGNGVVPLEAGYAVRTLASRLASRGSPGAALLAGVDHG